MAGAVPVPGAIAVATFEFAGADSSELTFLPGALWTVGTSDATQSSNLTNPDAVDAWRCLAALYPTLHEPRTPQPPPLPRRACLWRRGPCMAHG